MIFNKKKLSKKANLTINDAGLMKKMVSSYSVFLSAIILLLCVLYLTTLNNARNLYEVQNRNTVAADADYFEQNLYIMEMTCCQLLQNSDFRYIMNMEETSEAFFLRSHEVRNSLAVDIYPETFLPLVEMYVYLPMTGYIISPSTFCTTSFYYHKMRNYPEKEYSSWLTLLNNSDNWYRFLPMDKLNPHASSKRYMYIVDMSDYYFTDIKAVVCFVINEDKLARRFHIAESSHNIQIIAITDDAGNTIFAAEGRDTKRARAYVSEDSGYTYYYTQPSFFSTINIFVRILIFIVAIALISLLGGALITRLSRRNMEPVIELEEELQSATEEKKQLQEVVERQKPIITRSYIQRLLNGAVSSEEEIPYIKKYLALSDEIGGFNVLYAVAYNNSDSAAEEFQDAGSAMSKDEFDAVVNQALQRFLGEPYFCFSPEDRTYALLLTCEAGKADFLLMNTQSKFVRLHEYLLDTHGIWLFAGIGRTTASLTNVWECYEQASEAISYTSQNYFFFPYEIIEKNSNVFYYPSEISTKLIHFITTGNTAQVLELFNLIHQENIEERALPIQLLKYLLSDIRNTLLKARFALPSGADPDTLRELDERFNEHLSFKLCEDLALTLCRLFDSKTGEDDLISTVEKYIRANYADPSMGLNKISDEFRISESYFSHMFKEKVGVNFSNFLELIRMTEAARLIRETDTGLNELYIAVGYNNSASFRRAFKKVYGVSPSAMREQYPNT